VANDAVNVGRGFGLGFGGKKEAECGAPANMAFHGDNALVRLEDAMHHRQAQAGALADRLGGEEGSINALQGPDSRRESRLSRP